MSMSTPSTFSTLLGTKFSNHLPNEQKEGKKEGKKEGRSKKIKAGDVSKILHRL